MSQWYEDYAAKRELLGVETKWVEKVLGRQASKFEIENWLAARSGRTTEVLLGLALICRGAK
jgi:hypothetical protein